MSYFAYSLSGNLRYVFTFNSKIDKQVIDEELYKFTQRIATLRSIDDIKRIDILCDHNIDELSIKEAQLLHNMYWHLVAIIGRKKPLIINGERVYSDCIACALVDGCCDLCPILKFRKKSCISAGSLYKEWYSTYDKKMKTKLALEIAELNFY